MLGHRKRETTAINAHLNNGALRDAAAQAAAVTARTMGYGAESSLLPDEAEHSDTLLAVPECVGPATDAGAVPLRLVRQWREMCEARLLGCSRWNFDAAAIASWANSGQDSRDHSMKTLSAKDAKYGFGWLIDLARGIEDKQRLGDVAHGAEVELQPVGVGRSVEYRPVAQSVGLGSRSHLATGGWTHSADTQEQ